MSLSQRASQDPATAAHLRPVSTSVNAQRRQLPCSTAKPGTREVRTLHLLILRNLASIGSGLALAWARLGRHKASCSRISSHLKRGLVLASISPSIMNTPQLAVGATERLGIVDEEYSFIETLALGSRESFPLVSKETLYLHYSRSTPSLPIMPISPPTRPRTPPQDYIPPSSPQA